MYGNTEVTVAYVSDEVHGKLKSDDFNKSSKNMIVQVDSCLDTWMRLDSGWI